MPITEGTFTAAELQATVAANPALAAELKTFGTAAGYHIRTANEETEFLTAFEQQKIGAKTSEFANNIEKDIKEVFGEDKLENEKYHDYLKRVGGAAKQSLASMKAELESLKADPTKNTADKQRIKQLEDAITTEKQGAGTKLAAKDAEITKLKTGFEIERGLNQIRGTYILGIPKEAAEAMELAVVNKLLGEIKEVEPGKFAVMGADGSPKLDQTTYKPVTIEAELKERLASIIDKGRVQTGTGTNQQQQQQQNVEGVVKDAAGAITDVTSIPEAVKTKIDLHAHLIKLGLTEDSAVFIKAFEKLGEKLPLK